MNNSLLHFCNISAYLLYEPLLGFVKLRWKDWYLYTRTFDLELLFTIGIDLGFREKTKQKKILQLHILFL